MSGLESIFTGLPVDGVALGALVTFMVISLLKGWVVPRSVLIDIRATLRDQNDDLIKEKTDWREAFFALKGANSELLRQNRQLLDGAQTTLALVEALRVLTVKGDAPGEEK